MANKSRKTTLAELAGKKILKRIEEEEKKVLGEEVPAQEADTLNGPSGEIDPDAPAANIEPAGVPTNSDANKATITPKPSKAAPSPIPDKSFFTIRTEEIKKLFGEELSEDFVTKAAALFESAVNTRIDDIKTKLDEEYATAIEKYSTSLTEELSDALNEYMQYVAEQFVEENKLAIDTGLRSDIAENFLSGLRKLFDDSYVKMPDGKVDVVEELMKSHKELQEEINALLESNTELHAEITQYKCRAAFEDETVGLSEVAKERLSALAENVSFSSVSEFQAKVRVLKESALGKGSPSSSRTLTEEADLTDDEEEDGRGGAVAKKYAEFLGR